MAQSASAIRIVPATGGAAVTRAGKYRYIGLLAEGGMADVFLAVTQSAEFEKLVVIKQLHDSLAADPSFVTMFIDEARLAARLNHPNVVQTLEVGTDQPTGIHFIAMEFLEGVTYSRLTRREERAATPLSFHVRVLIDVLRGLHYAHELRDFDGKPLHVVHRDVSPQNIMLTFAGGVKVLDFGIAKASLADEQRPTDFKGKIEYMAPEQALREDVDRRADIFSVGIMLWEALARRRLYRKGDDKAQLLVDGKLPNIFEVAPSTPRRLGEICAMAMTNAREERYATADAMADDLEAWLASTAQHVTARDVGSFVANRFSSTRAKIAAAIDQQLTLFRALPEDEPVTIAFSRFRFADALSPLSQEAGASIRLESTPSLSAVIEPHVEPPVGAAPPPRKNTRALLAVGLVALTLVGGAGALAVRKAKLAAGVGAASASASAATTETATSASASASAVVPPAEATIELTIKASPPQARIFVDDEPLDSNPATEERPRDDAHHVLRIEAPGYIAREEIFTFDRSLFVSIDLRPESPAPDADSASVDPRARTKRPGHNPRPRGTKRR